MLKIYNILEKMEFLKEVATLEYEEWADKPEEDKEARIKRKMEKIKIKLKGKDFCKLILLDDDKLIGFISIFPQDCDECQKLSPWYATMYVKKEYRGQGYSKILNDAILKEARKRGYKEIYLQGHSLGCTKIVYMYNELKDEGEEELLKYIKGIILLSLIDIPTAIKTYLGENYESYMQLAKEKEENNKIYDLMPKEAFIHPISVKTFLRYTRDNEQINFAQYEKDKNLEKLNNIEVPLFMRWGNKNEMILQKADELVTNLNNIITNSEKDIDYIDGANHRYNEKEEILANQIINFINNRCK